MSLEMFHLKFSQVNRIPNIRINGVENIPFFLLNNKTRILSAIFTMSYLLSTYWISDFLNLVGKKFKPFPFTYPLTHPTKNATSSHEVALYSTSYFLTSILLTKIPSISHSEDYQRIPVVYFLL